MPTLLNTVPTLLNTVPTLLNTVPTLLNTVPTRRRAVPTKREPVSTRHSPSWSDSSNGLSQTCESRYSLPSARGLDAELHQMTRSLATCPGVHDERPCTSRIKIS